MHFWLWPQQIDQEQLIQSASDSESSQTFFQKTFKDKPEVVFDYLRRQDSKKNKKAFWLIFKLIPVHKFLVFF